MHQIDDGSSEWFSVCWTSRRVGQRALNAVWHTRLEFPQTETKTRSQAVARIADRTASLVYLQFVILICLCLMTWCMTTLWREPAADWLCKVLSTVKTLYFTSILNWQFRTVLVEIEILDFHLWLSGLEATVCQTWGVISLTVYWL